MISQIQPNTFAGPVKPAPTFRIKPGSRRLTTDSPSKLTKAQEREITKQANAQEREIAKQAKAQERETAKQAKAQEREIAKQAKLERKARVIIIKQRVKNQAKCTVKLLSIYREQEKSRVHMRLVAARQEVARIRQEVAQVRQEEVQVRQQRQAVELVRNQQQMAMRQYWHDELLRLRDNPIAVRPPEVDGPLIFDEQLLRQQRIVEFQPEIQRRQRHRVNPALQPRNTPVQPRIAPVQSAEWRQHLNKIQDLRLQDSRDETHTNQNQLICADHAFAQDECPICMETIGETNVMILRCGHKTCSDCIIETIQLIGGMKCPTCREQIGVRVSNWIPPFEIIE
jgi:hypothetical protein